MKLRPVLFIPLVSLGVAPLLVLIAFVLPQVVGGFESAAQEQTLASLRFQRYELNQRLQGQKEMARIISLLPAPKEILGAHMQGSRELFLSAEQAKSRLAGVLKRWFDETSELQAIVIADAHGAEVLRLRRVDGALVRAVEQPLAAEQGDYRWQGGPVAGSPVRVALVKLEEGGEYHLQIVRPITGRDGEVIGSAALYTDLGQVLGAYKSSFWIDQTGSLLQNPLQGGSGTSVFSLFPELRGILHGTEPLVVQGAGEALTAWVPLRLDDVSGNAVWIGSRVDRSHLERLLADFRYGFLSLAVALLVLAGVVASRITGRLVAVKEGLLEGLKDIIAGCDNVRFEWRHPRELRELSEELSIVASRHAAVNCERQKAEQALFREKELAQATLTSIGDGVITTDGAGRVEYMNPAAVQMTGWEGDRAKGQPFEEVCRLLDEASGEPVADPIGHCLQQGQPTERLSDARLLQEGGLETDVEYSAAPMFNRAGSVTGAVVALRDVSEQRFLRRQLEEQASHDSLTGVYNRRQFENHLEQALTEVRRQPGREHWLCYIDIDQFKVVNDTCGHLAGDELLVQVAATLRQAMRDEDVVARVGGDEFALLVRDAPLAQARTAAERAWLAIQEMHFVWDNKGFAITASMGMVQVDPSSGTIYDLLGTADKACFVAKNEGRNRIHLFNPDDDAVLQHGGEMEWVHRIRVALAEERFALYQQTIQPLQEEGRALHCEILVRMLDEEGDPVPPMSFIPAAERYNMMSEIDRWVVKNTLDAMEGWEAEGHGGECLVSINLSAQSLTDTDFLPYVLGQLNAHRVDPGHLCFEITETAAIANLSRAIDFINTVRLRGCRFSLDDFGSGLSSFGYLKNLPVDFLKIDGSFIKDMSSDPIDRAMVESINQVGHVIGIKTIAEFVEDEQTLELLRVIGVDYVQGYVVARPAPLAGVWQQQGRRKVAGSG